MKSKALNCFHTYLSDRTDVALIEGYQLSRQTKKRWEPPGTVLVPFMFNVDSLVVGNVLREILGRTASVLTTTMYMREKRSLKGKIISAQNVFEIWRNLINSYNDEISTVWTLKVTVLGKNIEI